jgi:hypothetical protein
MGIGKLKGHNRPGMKLHAKPPAAPDEISSATERRDGQQASARIVLLVVVCFLLGIAVSAYWFQRGKNKPKPEPETKLVVLSDGTKDVLKRLDSPVEIRFYSLLDPASVSESVRAFAGRVNELLSAFEREGERKVMVTRFNSRSDSDANAASTDGIQAFNLDKGDACFLGLTVARAEQKESFPRLSPEWEPAIEFDLARAIARVTATKPAETPLAYLNRTDTNATAEVKRALPNLGSMSLEEGTQVLREAALNEFKAAAGEMEAQLRQARERLTAAQNGKSEAEQQAAMKELQRIQAEQTEKLKQIGARLQAQIAELERLKKQ